MFKQKNIHTIYFESVIFQYEINLILNYNFLLGEKCSQVVKSAALLPLSCCTKYELHHQEHASSGAGRPAGAGSIAIFTTTQTYHTTKLPPNHHYTNPPHYHHTSTTPSHHTSTLPPNYHYIIKQNHVTTQAP